MRTAVRTTLQKWQGNRRGMSVLCHCLIKSSVVVRRLTDGRHLIGLGIIRQLQHHTTTSTHGGRDHPNGLTRTVPVAQLANHHVRDLDFLNLGQLDTGLTDCATIDCHHSCLSSFSKIPIEQRISLIDLRCSQHVNLTTPKVQFAQGKEMLAGRPPSALSLIHI